MTTINITIESPNPDLVAKVREGIEYVLSNIGLDVDAAGTYYDLELYATSDLPGENGVVYGSVFDGAQNNPEHPEHVDCADGCGLAVTHDGPCLDKPGGRVVCSQNNHTPPEEPS